MNDEILCYSSCKNQIKIRAQFGPIMHCPNNRHSALPQFEREFIPYDRKRLKDGHQIFKICIEKKIAMP